MQIGLAIGPQRGSYGGKVEAMVAAARWAEEAGLRSVWLPQIWDEFDVLTAAVLVGAATSTIEVGTSIVPVQPRHPFALAQQALSVQAVLRGRLVLGLGLSHHWIIGDMLGLDYERPALTMRCYLDVLDQALAGPGTVHVENELFRVHAPVDVTDLGATEILLAALGPVMLRLAGERTTGTTLWMADERTIASHVAPLITKAAAAAGRAAPRIVAGVPVCLCSDPQVEAAIDLTNQVLNEAEVSPNYQRLLEHGDARTSGDILAAGSESAIEERLRRFAEAGATDLNAVIIPLGLDDNERTASAIRTREFLASLRNL